MCQRKAPIVRLRSRQGGLRHRPGYGHEQTPEVIVLIMGVIGDNNVLEGALYTTRCKRSNTGTFSEIQERRI